MISIEFDDIIYSLQRYGGASVYWREITSRVEKDPRFSVRHLKAQKYLRGIPSSSRADVFHSSHFRDCISTRTTVVSTVHDLTYELGHVGRGLKAKLNILERKHSYFSCDVLICISESTKRDLLNVYPQLEDRCPIHVVHHGFVHFSQNDNAVEKDIQSFGPYVLYVGGRAGYKNFLSAVDGFYESKIWKDGVKLLCTGSSFTEEEKEIFSRKGLSDAVLSVGNVNQNFLAYLYKNAHCLLYTSIAEGFGLPLLEAMSMKCPVIACNVSCMPEVAGDAAMLVAPHSSEQISTSILALQDSELRSKLIASGLNRLQLFSWEKSADQHMNVYLGKLESNSKT